MILPITYEGRLVAQIEAEGDHCDLQYSGDWLVAPDNFPVSLTMPLGETSFDAAIVIPWLMNLLPEGEPLRAMGRALGASTDDVLGLVLETGGDLAGALAIGDHQASGEPGYRPLGDSAALERIINELPARPFLADEEGVTMSLAGAQDKLPVTLRENQLTIPVNGAASTHILKPDNPRLIGSVQNEAFCMVLARRIGLETAAVTTGVAGDRSYLLVERYDRTGDEPVRRTHQEDFCQALGRPPSAKYQFNRAGRRGPSLPEMFALTREHMTALDINRLLDAVIFNIAIGNVDSHAKNYSISLLHDAPRLAPLYDLMTGIAWDGITSNHAQEIGDQRRGLYIYGRHWQRFAKAAGLAPAGTMRRVEAITSRLLKELPAAAEEVAAMPAGAGPFLKMFIDAVGNRAAEVRAHAKVERPSPEGAENVEPSVSEDEASAYSR